MKSPTPQHVGCPVDYVILRIHSFFYCPTVQCCFKGVGGEEKTLPVKLKYTDDQSKHLFLSVTHYKRHLPPSGKMGNCTLWSSPRGVKAPSCLIKTPRVFFIITPVQAFPLCQERDCVWHWAPTQSWLPSRLWRTKIITLVCHCSVPHIQELSGKSLGLPKRGVEMICSEGFR